MSEAFSRTEEYSSTGSHTCLYHNAVSTLFDTMFYDLDHTHSFPLLLRIFLLQIYLIQIFPARLCFIFTKPHAKELRTTFFSSYVITYVCSVCTEIRAALCLVRSSASTVEKVEINMMCALTDCSFVFA